MKTIVASVVAFACNIYCATTYYVDASRPDDTGDGMSWASAKQTIQAAVDLAMDGDTVLVTNGVYDYGERVTPGYISLNRVVITNNILVQSVNGPAVTIILGQDSQNTSAVRGVYMSAGTLRGFTISNGFTHTDGDVDYDNSGGGANLCGGTATLSQCVLMGNSAQYHGGGAYYGTLEACVVRENGAGWYGGGTCSSVADGCVILSNRANQMGGGIAHGAARDCLIIGNNSGWLGGGAYGSTVYTCNVSHNYANYDGGGTCESTVENSLIASNFAARMGGGTYGGIINACMIYDNYTVSSGGGTASSIVTNCTIWGNYSDYRGGGTYGGTIHACIITGNTALSKGGGACGGVLNHCLISANFASSWGGGGAIDATLNDCIITGNRTATVGGGARNCILNGCSISSNTASAAAGGTYYCSVNQCTISANTAGTWGGGCMEGTTRSCVISGNQALSGGGVYGGTVRNCVIVGNRAQYDSGGMCWGLAINCTIASNAAPTAGGVGACALENSIVYFNVGSNWLSCTFSNCCTRPLPPGPGNTSSNPLFVDAAHGDYHLRYGSPCINAGVNLPGMELETDIDGNPRIQPFGGVVDMGAYEVYCTTSGSLEAPSLTEPVFVAAGGSGAMTVTNCPRVTLYGDKATGVLVTAPWLTNGVVQAVDEKSWTNQHVALQMAAFGATNVLVFRCMSTDFMTYSAATTVLLIVNYHMLPLVDITNQNVTVPYKTTSVTIAGTNNEYAVGAIVWTNARTGVSGHVPVSGLHFCLSDIALAVGQNVISVTATNTLGDTSNDSITIIRQPENLPPVIEPDALVFPGTDAPVLEAGMPTAIVWRVGRIWDNADETNLLVTTVAVVATNTGALVSVAGTNIPNVHGRLAWTPSGIESETNVYAVYLQVSDSDGNETSRTFVSNVFTVIPEADLGGVVAVNTLCIVQLIIKRRRAAR